MQVTYLNVIYIL